MASKSAYVKFIDNLPWLLKLILALPFFDSIIYGIYRILKGRVILGLLWILLGTCLGAVIDIVSVILYGKVKILA